MSAFLFLPAAGAKTARRVDIANIASLFAEIEEPARTQPQSSLLARVLALLLILLFAVGDFVLIARPDASALSSSTIAPAARAVTTL